MRLLCDKMLLRLGRWLRAAGYDTPIAAGDEDAVLIARCVAEGRILLTRDGRLAGRAAGTVPVVRLTVDGIASQAHALKATIGIDWLRAPFTRCLVDNAPLDPAPPEAADSIGWAAMFGACRDGLSTGAVLTASKGRVVFPGHARQAAVVPAEDQRWRSSGC